MAIDTAYLDANRPNWRTAVTELAEEARQAGSETEWCRMARRTGQEIGC